MELEEETLSVTNKTHHTDVDYRPEQILAWFIISSIAHYNTDKAVKLELDWHFHLKTLKNYNKKQTLDQRWQDKGIKQKAARVKIQLIYI